MLNIGAIWMYLFPTTMLFIHALISRAKEHAYGAYDGVGGYRSGRPVSGFL
jgi:hypothetical protein